MSRGDLTEVEWRTLKVLLPIEREPEKRGRGRPPKDNRSIINGRGFHATSVCMALRDYK